MTTLFLMMSLLACMESVTDEPLSQPEFSVDKTQLPSTEKISVPMPSGGARMFIRDGGTVTIATTHNGSITAEHTVEVGAGMVFTDDARTLKGTEGIFEINLNTWSSDSNSRDAQVKNGFFEIINNPIVFVDLTKITPLSEPLDLSESAETTASLALLIAGVRTDTEFEIRVQHKDNAYRFYSDAPQPLLISSLKRDNALVALVAACGITNINDQVMISMDLEMDWSGTGGMKKVPRPPPQLTTKITGKDAIKPKIKRDPDIGRDIKKDPKPHDLRKGNVKWKMHGERKDKSEDQPFE